MSNTINHTSTAHHLSTSEWLLPTRQSRKSLAGMEKRIPRLWECNNIWTECLLRKLKVALPSDPTILTRAYPSRKNNLLKEEPAFSSVAEGFIIAKEWNQPPCSLIEKWVKKNVKFICVFVWILFNHIKDEIPCL